MPSEEEIADLEAGGFRRMSIVHYEAGGEPHVIGCAWVKGGGSSLQYDKTLGAEVLVAVQNPAGDKFRLPVNITVATRPDLRQPYIMPVIYDKA